MPSDARARLERARSPRSTTDAFGRLADVAIGLDFDAAKRKRLRTCASPHEAPVDQSIMTSSAEVRARWLAHLHSTAPADRPRAEAAVRAMYAAAGFPEPHYFFWFDSPRAALWAVAALVPKEDRSSSHLLAPNVLSQEDKERLERTRTAMREQAGLPGWPEVAAAMGIARVGSLRAMMDPRGLFAQAFLDARYSLVDDISALFVVHGDEDDLSRAEAHFWGDNWGVLNSGLYSHPTNFLIPTIVCLRNDVLVAGG